MLERIQKILAARGIASRRKCEEMIEAGRVTCNGSVCCLGDRADPVRDTICLDGKEIPSEPKHRYILLNKPRGYVTTLSDEKGRRNVSELVRDCSERVYPVGRLDMDSEGLLLLTNDGDFANRLMHPRHEVTKTYRVFVTGYSPEAFEKLKLPIVLDGYRIREPEISLVSNNGDIAVILVTIHEGRNRQVRRMCDHAGMFVTRLIRISEGPVQLDMLPKGKWRDLTDEEVSALK